MRHFRKPEQLRDQMELFACMLDDAIEDDHCVRHLAELLESKQLRKTFEEWEGAYRSGAGQPPYHPRYMAGLYIYGMLTGIRSSRQLEDACHNRIDVRWLMSSQRPDHSTIAAFVKDHVKRLRAVFCDVVLVAKKAGLLKLSSVAVDGTTVASAASRRSVKSCRTIKGELAAIDQQLDVFREEWERNEEEESRTMADGSLFIAPSKVEDEKRRVRLEKRQERLRAALTAVKERQGNAARAGRRVALRASTSDPESRLMRGKDGQMRPNYNAQIAVDVGSGVVLETSVSDQADDSGQLKPVIDRVKETCEEIPQRVLADTAYNTGHDMQALEDDGIETYVPSHDNKVDRSDEAQAALVAIAAGKRLKESDWKYLPRGRNRLISNRCFVYEAESNSFRCPMGARLRHLRASYHKQKIGKVRRDVYGGCQRCAQCPKASLCCGDPKKGRMITRDEYQEARERLEARMRTQEGQTIYAQRGPWAEGRIAQAKSKVSRFLRKGAESAGGEWLLAALAINVGILFRNWEQVSVVLGP